MMEVERQRHGWPPEEGRQRMGWLCYRPDYLQQFNTARSLLVALCLAAVVQGMTQMGFVNVSLTTIERRHHLKSRDTGMIVGSFDVAFVLVCLPVSYLASRPGASMPRWLGSGMLLMGLGSLLYALPQFFTPPYREAQDSTVPDARSSESAILCNNGNSSWGCEPSMDSSLAHYSNMFLVGQILHGLGSTPIYVLGMVFLDQSVAQDMSSLYIGIFSGMFVGGAALGFGVGSSLLNVYVDWPDVDPQTVGLRPTSDLWLGGWWLCFLASSILSLLTGLLLLAFPYKIGAARHSDHAYTLLGENMSTTEPPTSSTQPTSFVSEIRKVFGNYTFMALAFAEGGPAFIGAGMGAFMPKIMENQFSISASKAALTVGMAGVPAGCCGSFFGGWILKKFNVDCTGALKLCTYGALLLVISSFAFLINCPNPDFAGIHVQYVKTSSPVLLPDLYSECNSNCGCDGVSYNPVCGANNVVYYSPCHAGCTRSYSESHHEMFTNCSCILKASESQDQETEGLQHNSPLQKNGKNSILQLENYAKQDRCPSSCNLMPLFITLFVIIIFIGFVLSMASVSAGLRCIDESQKSVAFGLRAQLSRIVGSMPGPVVFGMVLDRTCVQWQQSCGEMGSCAVYELHSMDRSVLYLLLVGRSVGALLFGLSWWFYFSTPQKTRRNLVRKESGVQFPLEEQDSTTRSAIDSDQENEFAVRHR